MKAFDAIASWLGYQRIVATDSAGPVGASVDPVAQLAQVTPTNATWQPRALAGDSATREAIELGLPRSREQVLNNPQWKGARNQLVDLCVGPGVQAFSEPFSPLWNLDDATLDADLAFAFESDAWFERWADDKRQCDAEGKLAWWDMQRSNFGELPVVGDAFFIRVNKRGPGRLVPYCLQLVEREQLDTSKDRAAAPGVNKIVNGIELDEYEQAVAYWIWDAHPDDAFYAQPRRSTRVPAERVIHAFVPLRPSCNVGFCWFSSLAQVGRDRNWLVGSELTKAAIGSLLTIVQKTKSRVPISLADGEPGTDALGNSIVKMATGGNTVRVEPGDEVEMFQPNTPSQTLPAFVDVLDHDAAAGAELSHLRYSRRWQNLSYSAGRGAQLDDETHCKPLKNWWGRSVVLPVRQAVNAQLAAMGKFSTVSAMEFVRDELRYQAFFCIGAGREYLDPEGETNAAKDKLGAGLTTLRDECGKQGLHWVRVLRQIRLENRIMGLLGIQLDFSKGGGQQLGTRVAGTSTNERRSSNAQGT